MKKMNVFDKQEQSRTCSSYAERRKQLNLLNISFYILGSIATLYALCFVIGAFLPSERTVTREAVFDVPPETLYKIVTNNNDWQHRTSLRELNITQHDGIREVWEETTHKGSKTVFWTKEKNPYSSYSFNMSAKFYMGNWTMRFEETEQNKTHLTTTARIKINNSFVKILSYFFDVDKRMENYQQELKQKVNGIA